MPSTRYVFPKPGWIHDGGVNPWPLHDVVFLRLWSRPRQLCHLFVVETLFFYYFFYFYFFLMFQSTNRCCVNVPRAFKWRGNVVFNGVSHSGGLICGHSATLCAAVYLIRYGKRNFVFLSDVKILSCMTIHIPVASGVLRHDVVSLRHTVLLPQHSNLLLNSKLTHSLAYTLTWVNWNSGL